MNKILKWGGFAGISDPTAKISMLKYFQSYIYLLNFIIYILFGAALVVLTISIFHLLKKQSPYLMQAASVFGFIRFFRLGALLLKKGNITAGSLPDEV